MSAPSDKELATWRKGAPLTLVLVRVMSSQGEVNSICRTLAITELATLMVKGPISMISHYSSLQSSPCQGWSIRIVGPHELRSLRVSIMVAPYPGGSSLAQSSQVLLESSQVSPSLVMYQDLQSCLVRSLQPSHVLIASSHLTSSLVSMSHFQSC